MGVAKWGPFTCQRVLVEKVLALTPLRNEFSRLVATLCLFSDLSTAVQDSDAHKILSAPSLTDTLTDIVRTATFSALNRAKIDFRCR